MYLGLILTNHSTSTLINKKTEADQNGRGSRALMMMVVSVRLCVRVSLSVCVGLCVCVI